MAPLSRSPQRKRDITGTETNAEGTPIAGPLQRRLLKVDVAVIVTSDQVEGPGQVIRCASPSIECHVLSQILQQASEGNISGNETDVPFSSPGVRHTDRGGFRS